jgi:6-pyruvoyltetrahydropterin/6-carboxytetrahydropterin synthase
MADGSFRVRVTKDHLVFSAAHFITFAGTICERLHGHNWRVACEVAGPLDENAYVFDFIALRDALQAIVNQLDHHVLLPTKHRQISVRETSRLSTDAGDGAEAVAEVEARFENRRWLFPREDCVLLPIENTTAERIAEWISGQLAPQLKNHPGGALLEELQVEVEENFGQWAIHRTRVR